MTGSPTQGIQTVLHPVSDLAKAKAVYAALLGVEPQTDGSYVGFEAAGQHVGLVPGGGPQRTTCRCPAGIGRIGAAALGRPARGNAVYVCSSHPIRQPA